MTASRSAYLRQHIPVPLKAGVLFRTIFFLSERAEQVGAGSFFCPMCRLCLVVALISSASGYWMTPHGQRIPVSSSCSGTDLLPLGRGE